jgi:hypothetical protein
MLGGSSGRHPPGTLRIDYRSSQAAQIIDQPMTPVGPDRHGEDHRLYRFALTVDDPGHGRCDHLARVMAGPGEGGSIRSSTRPSRGREQRRGDAQMSETAYEPTTGYDERTGWTGWIAFAGVMMIIGGALNLLYGIIAAVNDEWVVWTNRGDVYLDVSEWGWVHIILGAIVLLSGIGVFSGNILARTVGVIVASISLIANFFFLPVYPLWSLIVITIDVLVIWALTAHGREVRKA